MGIDENTIGGATLALDTTGSRKVELDELHAKRAPYTFNGDLNNGGDGLQAFANTNERKLYITNIYLKENATAAETFQIFDGTVAAGTKSIDIDVAADGVPRIKNMCPIGPFTSASGIYVYTTGASDMSLVLSVTEDPGITE